MAASVRIAPSSALYQDAASYGCHQTFAGRISLHQASVVKASGSSSVPPYRTAPGPLCGVYVVRHNRNFCHLTSGGGGIAERPERRAKLCGPDERWCIQPCWPNAKRAAKPRTFVPCQSSRSSGNASGESDLEMEQNGGGNSSSLGNGGEDANWCAASAESSDGPGGQGLPHKANPRIDKSIDAAAVSLSSTTSQQITRQHSTPPASLPGPLAAAKCPPPGGPTYETEGPSYAYEGRSYEWRLQQAVQVVALQLQSAGVEVSEAVQIATAAPQYCQSLVDKVSEMDGPPDIWEDLGLLSGESESAGRNAPSEAGGERAENEEEASVAGREGAKLTAAFGSAYQLSGVPEPAPPERRREKVRKGKKAAGGGPGGVEASPQSKRKREWKLRGVRKRAEEQSELEELLGIGPTRGEPYRLAEWEKEQAAMENGGEEELAFEGGGAGEEFGGGGGGLPEDGIVGGEKSQAEGPPADGVNRGGVIDGSVNGGDVGGLNGLEGAGGQPGEGADEISADWQESDGVESGGSTWDSSKSQGADEDISLGSSPDLKGSEASELGTIGSSSKNENGNGMAAEGSEIKSTLVRGDKVSAEAAYRWKLHWCADESRGGGSLPPFFESVGIPPNEIKRIVRALKRSRGAKGRAILPITEIITRVRVFERLFRCADGLGAAERILVRGRDETLSKMREDDDIERNVRYLEAAVAAIREQEIRAATSSSVSESGSSSSSVLGGSSRKGSDGVADQQTDLSLAPASSGADQPEADRSLAEHNNRSETSNQQSASTHVASGLSSSNAALEESSESPSRYLQGSPPRAREIEGLSSRLDDGVSSVNPAQYAGNPVANPSTSRESKSVPSNPSSSLSTTARETPDQLPTPSNPASRGLSRIANTPANPEPNPETLEETLVNPNPNPRAPEPPWGVSLVVSSFPELLFPSLETKNFARVAAYMEREIGMTSAEAANALLLFPPAFALDVETELKPRMRDLKVG